MIVVIEEHELHNIGPNVVSDREQAPVTVADINHNRPILVTGDSDTYPPSSHPSGEVLLVLICYLI